MKKFEYNNDIDMLFTAQADWHADIWLPAGAQITEIHLRVYSFTLPDNVYSINWGTIHSEGNRLRIPIDASKPDHSDDQEAVRLAIDITYYSEI